MIEVSRQNLITILEIKNALWHRWINCLFIDMQISTNRIQCNVKQLCKIFSSPKETPNDQLYSLGGSYKVICYNKNPTNLVN